MRGFTIINQSMLFITHVRLGKESSIPEYQEIHHLCPSEQRAEPILAGRNWKQFGEAEIKSEEWLTAIIDQQIKWQTTSSEVVHY